MDPKGILEKTAALVPLDQMGNQEKQARWDYLVYLEALGLLGLLE